MPNSNRMKTRIRARMRETGEKYTTAMRAIQAEDEQATNEEVSSDDPR